MNKRGLVYYLEELAGEITETEDGDFVFTYDSDYLISANAKPLSYSLPLQEDAFQSQYIKGFFDGLLPEGWILNLAVEYYKFNPIRDRYQILLKTCFDPVGAVSIRESEEVGEANNPHGTELGQFKQRKETSPGKCLYCYEELSSGEYHEACSKKFFGSSNAPQIDLTEEVLKQLGEYHVANGLSIPGVQKKISLDSLIDEKGERLTLSNFAGKYILKPKGPIPHIPENEDLIMKLAKSYGLPVSENCLIFLKDGELATLSRRLDRVDGGQKIHMEDFCQILDQVTDKKYVGSYQKVGKILKKYCASQAPKDQLLKLFELVIFSYLVGNADLHLKNISVLHHGGPRLCPAYDLLSFEIFQEDFAERDNETMALSINGKKNKFKKEDFDELAKSFEIKPKVRDYIYKKFLNTHQQWEEIIEKSFLAKNKQLLLKELIAQRSKLLI